MVMQKRQPLLSRRQAERSESERRGGGIPVTLAILDPLIAFSVVLPVVFVQFQLALAPQIRISDVTGDPAVHWLLVLIQMKKLLWAQPFKIRPSSQDGQMMCDRHNPLSREIAGERSDPGKLPLTNIGNILSVDEAVVILAEQIVQFTPFRVSVFD